jgi:hypothetical protein
MLRGDMTPRRAALVTLLLVATSAAAARLAPPPTVEIDGCVMPAKACAKPRDVIVMRLGDEKLDFGVERLSLPTSNASSAKVLTELRLRGVSVHGPGELTARLVKGAHLRLRGVLRPGPYLLMQSVEARPDD